jgi:putative transposase
VIVAAFIADQRTSHNVPHATTACRALGVSESWYYKWLDRGPTATQRRRAELDRAVARGVTDSGGL